MKSHSRKGQVIDLVMSPMFVISVGVLVFVITLMTIGNIGSQSDFEKKFYAADLALSIDSLYAPRPDVNFKIDYFINNKFSYQIKPKKTIIYEKTIEDGKAFHYTEDPEYSFVYGETDTKKKDPKIQLFRTGRQLGVLKGETNFATPYCERETMTKYTFTINEQSIQNIEQEAIEYATGGILIKAKAKTGEPILKIYVNKNPVSAQIACQITEKMFNEFPNIQGYVILPVNGELIDQNDSRQDVAKTTIPAAYVEITISKIDTQTKAQMNHALMTAVNAYAN